jgi:hypothetical protein
MRELKGIGGLGIAAMILMGSGRTPTMHDQTQSVRGAINSFFVAPGEKVEVRDTENGPVRAHTEVGADNTFQVAGLTPGTYLVTIGRFHQRVVTLSAEKPLELLISKPESCSLPATATPRLSDSEVAEMLRLAIDLFGLPPEFPEPPPHDDGWGPGMTRIRNNKIRIQTPLVTDGLSRQWLTHLGDLPLLLVSTRRAQSLADKRRQPAYYMQIKDVRTSLDCSAVTVLHSYMLDKRSKTDRPLVIGFSENQYRFRRRQKHWEFDLISMAMN